VTNSDCVKQHGNSPPSDQTASGVSVAAKQPVTVPIPGSAVFPYVPVTAPGQQQIEMWHGPFPPPQAVHEYEQLLPGSWDRLLRMAEEAQAAQIQTMRNAQEFLRRDTKRGHILGVVAMLAAMGGAIYCVHVDHAGVAVAFLSVTVMAVVRALIETAKSSHATAQMTPSSPPNADLPNSRTQSGREDRG
jgi:uncharacterized membrane protein